MPDIAALVASLGGMAQKQQLVARGARDLDLTLAVRRGEVERARQGWYTTLPSDDPAVRAVRVGGRLTGMSAVIALGGWSLGRHPLHVSLRDNAARLRTPWNRHVALHGRHPPNLRLHWDGGAVAARGSATVVDLRDALVRVVLDEEFETAVAAIDWALHSRLLSKSGLAEIVMALPLELRFIRDWVDPLCESLPESLARTRLSLRGHSVISQAHRGDADRIDLVVDESVGMETDGDEFHWDRFEPDRMKDLDITIANLTALRPSARAVFHHWPKVLLAVETAIAARASADRAVVDRASADRAEPGSAVAEGASAARPSASRVGNSGRTPPRLPKRRGKPGHRRGHRHRTPEFPKKHGKGGEVGIVRGGGR